MALGSPADGASGMPVSVQWTPTYAAVDSTAAEEGNDMALGGTWIPEQVGNEVKKGAVHFRWNKYRYESGYMDNAQAAATVRKILEEIGLEHVDSVIVTAYASPEGVYEHNQMLSRKRAKEFDTVVKKELGLAAEGLNLIVRPGGEAWALLKERIVSDENISDVARERILRLLDNDKIGWDTKKWRMENGWLGQTPKEGDIYRWMLTKHYRYLRSLAVDIYVSNVLVAVDGQTIDVVPEEPTVIPEEPADTLEQPVQTLEEPVDSLKQPAQTPDQVGDARMPLQRLAEIVSRPFKVGYKHLCKLAKKRIVVVDTSAFEEFDDDKTVERLDSIQHVQLLEQEHSRELAGRGDKTPEAIEDDKPFWPVIGIGTNLLYDATYIPGYGFTSIPSATLEYYPESGKYTIGADVEWPNWKHADEHRYFQVHNISLWGRYYFNPEQYRFNGWYLSGSANGAMFGVGWNKKGWNGEGLGISVGGGHKWTFGRIYIDAGLALGVFYARYDSYTWGGDATGWYYYDYAGDPDDFEPRLKRWLWLGPTRLQVTIGVDLFNRNHIKRK
ncbi:MAG: DUF3575 domain-containing protein [Bacteroidales bacterium]|nr:DUF3575 domain-containing protein [Bacteroidales bacterium]